MYEAEKFMASIKSESTHVHTEKFDNTVFLQSLNKSKFIVGFYDKNKKIMYSEIETVLKFKHKSFFQDGVFYIIYEDTHHYLDVDYIVMGSKDLVSIINVLRIKFLSYFIIFYLFIGIIGYLLGKFFLRPVWERLMSLDQFIADTTHELNTPIAAILMTVESLKGIEEKKMKRLDASAKRLSIMYSSLTYRIEGIKESSIEICLKEMIEERVTFFKELIEAKNIEVLLDLERQKIYMSKGAIERLLDNLISNAIKYSNVNDHIMITLKKNILIIKDTGIGMDIHVQKNIFKRYFHVDNQRGGFGIGLSIVSSICKDFKIKVDMESKKGEGTTFTLTFPKMKKRR